MHPVILICGASGGLGASTLAAVTALTLAASGGEVVLVDGDLESGGADCTAAVEERAGLRWPDLHDLDGGVDAAGLRAALPAGEVPVLAACAGRAAPPSSVVHAVVRALARESALVLDVPRHALARREWTDLADLVVVLAGVRPRWLRDAEACVGRLGDHRGRVVIVTRGDRRAGAAADAVAEHLACPVLAHLGDDPAVVRDEGRGRAPRGRGPMREVAAAIVEVAGASGRARPVPQPLRRVS